MLSITTHSLKSVDRYMIQQLDIITIYLNRYFIPNSDFLIVCIVDSRRFKDNTDSKICVICFICFIRDSNAIVRCFLHNRNLQDEGRIRCTQSSETAFLFHPDSLPADAPTCTTVQPSMPHTCLVVKRILRQPCNSLQILFRPIRRFHITVFCCPGFVAWQFIQMAMGKASTQCSLLSAKLLSFSIL